MSEWNIVDQDFRLVALSEEFQLVNDVPLVWSRAVNGKIIHVQSVRTKDHPEFTVFGRSYGLLLGSPGAEFVEELRPLPGENVVQKTSHDCFYETSMEAVLEKLDLRPCRDKIDMDGVIFFRTEARSESGTTLPR